MRTLLLVDNKSKEKEARLIAAIEKVKADYGGELTYQIQYQDYDDAPWTYYDEAAMGLDIYYINKLTKDLYTKHNLEFDNVITVVDNANWKDGKIAIGGWNIGGRWNNYYVQTVRFMDSDEWLYKAFAMEIIHMWDDATHAETRINLDNVAGMDWDYDVIHGENPKWGRDVRGTNQEKWTRTGYYTDYNYSKVIQEFGHYFKAAMASRQKKYDDFISGLKQQISLLTQIIELLKKLRQLQHPQVSAITIGELSGEGEPYHHKH